MISGTFFWITTPPWRPRELLFMTMPAEITLFQEALEHELLYDFPIRCKSHEIHTQSPDHALYILLRGLGEEIRDQNGRPTALSYIL